MPDCTRTSTVPEPAGARTVTCASSAGIAVAWLVPNHTLNRPAAPEKLRPEIVTEVPAAPCVGLTLVTAGARSTTSKFVNQRLLSPCVVSWMSLSFHVREKLLLASGEELAPVMKKAEPLSATINP